MDQSLIAPLHDGEDELWRALAGPRRQVAREKLFSVHEPYARGIARRWFRRRSRGELDFADVYQLACEGLLEAIDRFDPARGLPLRAYAARRIEGCIASGMARMTELRDQRSSQARLRSERLRSLATPDAINADDALDALSELAVGLALGFMLEDSGLYLADERRPAPGPSAYDSAAWSELVTRMEEELAALPERERQILVNHYKLGMGFDTLGRLLGVSKGRVSQLHRSALIALRRSLQRRGHFGIGR
jgi:RNA polymerase sigma factor for flagellar operon FliA